MRITKYGHSCLLVEQDGARLLLDPGSFARGIEPLTGLTAVLITHQHGDHVDAERLPPLLAANPGARLVADEGTAAQLADRGLDAETAREGDTLDFAGTSVRVLGREHAVIHPDIPNIPNVGYLVAERFFHPGDAFTVPDVAVDVLAVPAVGPWMKISEAVDYLRAVAPNVAVPVHDAVAAQPPLWFGLLDRLKPGSSRVQVIEPGSAAEF